MILFLFLAIGTFAYLWWKWHHTTLTRECRWRQDRTAGDWYCVHCGGRTVTDGGKPPKICVRGA
ncbi:hypothetical protein [Pseudoruegeria sp. HB172150]|uniref:hypothetical protein n=1 Tax=Pseudoruegeria sp. HB172150 TaxID=2721164 RepID=UPI001552FC0F|nr:hypothetical protein [Pseudoruegeria sp. HB172150]